MKKRPATTRRAGGGGVWSLIAILAALASVSDVRAQIGGTPVITLVGEDVVSILQGQPYVDPGAVAIDPEDGLLTPQIFGIVDIQTPDIYTLTYSVTDSHGNSASTIRIVTVLPNNPPSITLSGENPQVIRQGSTYAELGATATDPEDGDLAVQIDSSAVDIDVVGEYIVVYSVTDSHGNVASVNRTVTVVPSPPTITLIGEPSMKIAQGEAFEDPGATATDPEDGDITASIVVSGAVDSSTPGTYTLRYDVMDAQGNAAPTVERVVIVNSPPIAADDAYETDEDVTLTVPAPGVIANDSDADGDDLTVAVVDDVTPANSGELTLRPNGSFDFVPAPNFVGEVTFTYQAFDGSERSGTATVTIAVIDVNDPPVASADSYVTEEDGRLAVPAPGVLENDDDDDGDGLTAELVRAPASGTVTLNANGSFEYVPNADFNGMDTFTYRASDGTASSEPATVTIEVTPVNDPPTARNDAYQINEDATLQVTPANGVLVNDNDPDGDTLTAVLVTGLAADEGTLTLQPNGAFTYDPPTDFNGEVSFTYRARDPAGAESASATVTITVNAVNDPPELLEDIVAPNATESIEYTFDLAPYFHDAEGDDLYFDVNFGPHPTGLPESRNLVIDSDGSRTGVRGRIFGTPTLDDTSDDGPRTVTVTVRDRSNDDDPEVGRTAVPFALTISSLDRVDVGITASAAPDRAVRNEAVAWRFTVSNANPFVAVDDVTLDLEFSGVPVDFTNTTGCAVNGQTLNCIVGPIPADGTFVHEIRGSAGLEGEILVKATVSAPNVGGLTAIDPNEGNNAASFTLHIGDSFSTGPGQSLERAANSRAVAAGDLDGDGYVDLVVGMGAGESTLVFLSVPMDPQDPDGEEFRRLSASPITLGDVETNARHILLVDIDGDDDLDIVVANGSPGAPQPNGLFINELDEGHLQFVRAAAELGAGVSFAVAAADLDGAGLPDLVFANGSPNELYTNLGAGRFAPVQPIGDGDSRAVVIADLDGDHAPDIIFANTDGPSVVHRNLGGGTFDNGAVVETLPATSVTAADIDGNGLPDLLFGLADSTGGASKVAHLNTSASGTIRFTGGTELTGIATPVALLAADINLDGIADLVAINATGTHQILIGNGRGGFTLHAEQFTSAAPTGATAGDFNNDGRTDIAVSGRDGVQIFFNDGRGNLGPGDVEPPVIQLVGAATVDLTVEEPYTDPGATATDAIDGDVTSRIIVDNPVDIGVIGTYTVRYVATDLSGNKSQPVTRTVRVQARQAQGGGGGGAFGPALPLFLVVVLVLRRRRDYSRADWE
jgi:VCBS repeat-containing protein